MSDDTDDAGSNRKETREIKVKKSVYQRFEERRKATKNDHLPAMTSSLYLKSLLDTEEAVREGWYDE